MKNEDSARDDAEIVSPRADSLMASLRATGYTVRDAIADLIDNSITALAKNVWLTFHWSGPDSWIAIEDDGTGMSEKRLVEAMRFGSTSPLEPRDPRDLGRYGLGLKTASLSQGGSLTVVTLKRGTAGHALRRWDMDHIASTKEWSLLREGGPASDAATRSLLKRGHGTVVVWDKLDRLVTGAPASDSKAQQDFLEHARAVEQHVAMTFHRFLTGPSRLRIWVNQQPIDPWDPFLEDHAATQAFPVEELRLGHKVVVVAGFVLPHQSRLSEAQRSSAAGPEGWNAHQGFYVYRNRRMLLAGDWLGLGHRKGEHYKKEEHYKLARIRVDIPNDMDDEWGIDVRKSRAAPPAALQTDLRRIAAVVRGRAVEVYRHRGKVMAKSAHADPSFVWQRKTTGGKISYVVNRQHPLVKSVLRPQQVARAEVEQVIRLAEAYVPTEMIWVDTAQGTESQAQPFEQAKAEEVMRLIRAMYDELRLQGAGHDDAVARILNSEICGNRVELVESALAGHVWEGNDG